MIAEPLTQRRIWAYDEVREIDDDVRRELHDGEIYEMPSPLVNHQSIILRLAILLSEWARANGGRVYLSPVDLYVCETTYYIPDLVFYSAAQMASGEVERDPRRLTVAATVDYRDSLALDRAQRPHAQNARLRGVWHRKLLGR